MVALSPRVETLPLIAKMEAGKVQRGFGKGVGPSYLGDPCKRKIWFKFRWAAVSCIETRIERLFKRGHVLERLLIRQLKENGVVFISTQKRRIIIPNHMTGFTDGIIAGVPGTSKEKHILEIKSAKGTIFNAIVKHGIQKTVPEYFVQVQIYMEIEKVKRCLLLVINKNDDHIHGERIKFDGETGSHYIERGIEIINTQILPPPIDQKLSFKCGFCDYKGICIEGGLMLQHCRTCINSEPIDCNDKTDKAWRCNWHDKAIGIKEQKEGCKKYQSIPI